MNSRYSFLYEATRCLFSSLNPEISLLAFFRHVQKRIPLREFNLNKVLLPYDQNMRVAWVNQDDVTAQWTLLPVSAAQHKAGEEMLALLPEQEINERMVLDESDPLFRYVRHAPGSRLKPPFFLVRLLRDSSVIGSAAFQTTRALDQEEQALLKDLEPPLCIALNNLLQHKELTDLKEQLIEDNEKLRRRLDDILKVEIIGRNSGLSKVMNRVRLAAPVDIPVLITGETGSGKDVIAQAIHEMSYRRDKTFVAVNCGAIPPSLIDSELFGHTRGAFTGAGNSHKGRFERADGGTLFLDEVGELPLEAQSRLLRVLESGEVEKVGGSMPVKVDIRLIAATHRNLSEMVAEGRFREDLYYRLKVVCIKVPPLRERRQDIPDLANFLLRKSAARYGVIPPVVDKAEMDALVGYSWPGNVRQLQNVLEEAMVCSSGNSLHFTLPEDAGKKALVLPEDGPLPDMDGAMRDYLWRCLRASQGRVEGPNGAARIAGLSPSTFRFRCKKLGVPR